jgi:hexosaminidase
MSYTVAEQEDIVEHARLRGVRIVLELDLPGHSDVWAFGAPPGAFLDCRISSGDAQSAVLDVTSDAAYGFLEQLLTEIFSRFPDKIFHLGGDEVNSACWKRSATVQTWLKAHPEVTLDELYPRYIVKVHQMLAAKFNRSGTTSRGR